MSILWAHTQRVLAKVVADEVRLEEGAHLRVARPGVVQDDKVQLERGHVDDKRKDDEACHPSDPMPGLVIVRHPEVAELMPEVLDGVDTDDGSDEEADEFYAVRALADVESVLRANLPAHAAN
jgi:hypothetical protein